ncbi:hypothetical protein B0H14DRAFT_3021088 [Mycena olivaceomarginata]|nr:hypothetical protein B0H14DRAFT_3021088 [Mycena olivaceomarginata]
MHLYLRSAVVALCNTQKRFNSSALARIYTFRAVLLLNISTIVAGGFFNDGYMDPIIYGPSSFILIHHLIMLYPWRTNWVVIIIDLVLALAESACSCFLLGAYWESSFLTWPIFFGNAVALLLSLYFHCVAGPTCRRFTLLGGCISTQPPYNSWEVLFGRSALRPLVRGESRAIAFVRGMILVSLCIAIPAFGCYFTVIVPIRATVMTRNVRVAHPWSRSDVWYPLVPEDYGLKEENISMVFFYVGIQGALGPPSGVNVTIAKTTNDSAQICTSFIVADRTAQTAMCPYPWSHFARNLDDLIVSASFTDPPGILYVKTGQGNPEDVDSYGEVIPLRAGSHLSAFLSRTQRQFFSKNAQDIFGFTTPFRSVTLNTVLMVHTDPSPPDSALTTLRLHMREDLGLSPAEIVQDYTDASILNGIATFGGFWTFVNGAFAMVFGANVLYFLFRRRPLSALGIVHIFQLRKLTRKWNEDFPALYTEGGQPGSKSAGIVAFLRERLVDLDDKDHSGDLEAQNTTLEQVYHPVSMKDDAEVSGKATPTKPKPHTDTSEMEEIPRSSGP